MRKATVASPTITNVDRTYYLTDDPRFSYLALNALSLSFSSSPANQISSKSAIPLPSNFTQTKLTDPNAITTCLTSVHVSRISKSLQTDVSEISELRSLHSYGVDSLVAIEIVNWLHREADLTLTAFEVL